MSRRTRRFTFPILMPTVLSGGSAAVDFATQSTYYVDSVNGNDANDGLSQAQAFENLSALPTLVSGDIVGLANGSSWSNQKIRVPANNVQIGAYSATVAPSATKPIIDCSNIETGWTLAGGTTNVYEKVITFDADDRYDTSTWINVLADGAFLTNVANQATCDSTAGSYYVSSHAAASVTIGVHTATSADPDTDGVEYRVTKKSHAVDARAQNNIKIYNIEAIRSYHKGGCVKVGENSLVQGCNLLQGNVHNVYLSQNSILRDCIVNAWYTTESMSFIVFNQDTPSGGSCIVDNCLIGDPTTYEPTASGIYCHNNISGEYSQLIITDTTFRHAALAIGAFHVPVVNCSGLTFTNCGTVHRMTYPGITYNFTNCHFANSDSTASRWLDGTITVASEVTVNLTGCSFESMEINNACFFVNKDNYTINLLNSTFKTEDSTAGRLGIWYDNVTTPGSVSVNWCEFNNGDNGRGWVPVVDFELLEVGNTITYTGDNNVWDGDFGWYLRHNNTVYQSSDGDAGAGWKSSTGQDANSIFVPA